MIAAEHSAFSFSRRGVFRWLFALHCLFIIYGSFIPFEFNLDANFTRWRYNVFLRAIINPGLWWFSTPDLVSNVLLFVPFGFFLIGADLKGRTWEQCSAAFLKGGFLGALFGLIIELGQFVAPGRTPSFIDVICNGTGAVLGACIGHILFREMHEPVESWLRRIADQRPSLFALVFLLLAPIVSSYYPFDVTLDFSTVWGNLRRVELLPFKRGLHRPWPDLLLEKVLEFAAISYIVKQNLPRAKGITQAWLITAVAAAIIESVKLFFVNRTPNLDNVVWMSIGAALGATVVPFIASLGQTRRREKRMILLLMICVLAYFELQPFDWISAQEISDRLSDVEWLPFGAYYFAHPQAALLDLMTKVYLSAPMGFLLIAQRQSYGHYPTKLMTICACSFLGLCLEAAQLALRSRSPSVTDVAILGLGSWLGAVAFERFQSLREPKRLEERFHDADAEFAEN